MSFREFIEDLWCWFECFWEGPYNGPTLKELTAEVDPVTTKVYRDPQDKILPNLFIGKIIDDGSIKCEVVDVHKTNIHVKILEIRWERLGTYLDIGKVYPVFKHRGWDESKIQVWEISPKRMKRDTSQVILQWEEGIGWVWDLDM